MRFLVVPFLLGVTACRCSRPTAPELPAVAPHYGEWERLVGSAVRGDRIAVNTMARDLTVGAGLTGDESAAAEVGAALGFLQVADEDGLVFGVVRAAAACGSCHAGQPPPPRPPFTDDTAAIWMVDGLVWNRPTLPPADAPATARAAYGQTPDTGIPAVETRVIWFLEALAGPE